MKEIDIHCPYSNVLQGFSDSRRFLECRLVFIKACKQDMSANGTEENNQQRLQQFVADAEIEDTPRNE